jgi:signal peptidase I
MTRTPTLPAEFERTPENGERCDGSVAMPESQAQVDLGQNPGPAPAAASNDVGRTVSAADHPVHGVPEAVSSLMRTIIVALFVLTFLAQPMVIPSESMERTLLVGDFLLMNRSALAPPGIWRKVLPYRAVERGEIVTFRSPLNPKELLVKRVIGLPGDRLRIDNGQVLINDQPLSEPYAAFEPTVDNPYLDHFPTRVYSDPGVEPGWWKQLQESTQNGELVIPPSQYFMLGDNRNHSRDSRYWGFVAGDQIIAHPLVIYFSLRRPSRTDLQQASDDRLGHESEFGAYLKGFARWKRIFHVVH